MTRPLRKRVCAVVDIAYGRPATGAPAWRAEKHPLNLNRIMPAEEVVAVETGMVR